MNILFITSNRVGDAVLSTGLLRWLSDQYPSARITIACGPFGSGLFRAVPNLSRLIIIRKLSWNRHWLSLWRACAGTDWDLIIDLRNSIISRLLRAKTRAYAPRMPHAHKVVEIAATLNLKPAPAPKIWLDQAAEAAADTILPREGTILALAPAANWYAKQWPVERFTALAKKLTTENEQLQDACVLIIADKAEREHIVPLLQSIPDHRRIELIGHDLLTVAACLKRASLFIGNDSGLMHMAAAVGTKTLGLFGPGYEEIYGPWGAHCAFVRTEKSRDELLDFLAKNPSPTPNLMESLSVEKVYAAAKSFFKSDLLSTDISVI